jgi:phenylacetate-CoA ligase
MLAALSHRIESMALRTAPRAAAQALGVLPPSALEALQRARFRRTLRHAAERSLFYREAFRRRNIDVTRIDHPSQLGDFYTTGEDLRTHGPDAFAIGRATTAFETTGTTSPLPKQILFSQRELDAMGCASAAALMILGLRRDDIVLSAFDCSFWVSPAVVRSALQYIGCFHVEAGKIDPAEFYDRALRYRPTIILGEPSWLVRVSDIARTRGTWPIRFLCAGGENLTEEARLIVERAWHAPLYLNYGQTEAFGSLGLECREKQGYHRNDLHFLFEIDNADETGHGELIYTTLSRDVMPLIRYRSSDITQLIDSPCACGLFARRIAKIRGRADEMVVCGMGNVGPWVFSELLHGVPIAADEWQAVVTHDGRRDMIDLRIECDPATTPAAVQRIVLDNLEAKFSDFWKNRQMGLYDIRVAVVPPGSLRQDRKLRRVVDQRQMEVPA